MAAKPVSRSNVKILDPEAQVPRMILLVLLAASAFSFLAGLSLYKSHFSQEKAYNHGAWPEIAALVSVISSTPAITL